ncbi:MAG: KEOPS complex subunit Pcc1 [Euryarchaeota archaeon]|nr:KEOPS complex subunit Pcc1 [Euryarchaeota archaeon]
MPLKSIAENAFTKIEIEFPDEKAARIIYRALLPEVNSLPSERVKVSLSTSKNTLSMEINALDTVALRAAVNSYLRWIILAREIYELKEEK